jgi:hypothetical protein
MRQYLDKEKLASIKAEVSRILKKWKMKGSVSCKRRTLVVTLYSGPFDLMGKLNEHSRRRHMSLYPEFVFEPHDYLPLNFNIGGYDSVFSEEENNFVTELDRAINDGNWDDSDPTMDFYNCGWTAYIHIGRWNRNYRVKS